MTESHSLRLIPPGKASKAAAPVPKRGSGGRPRRGEAEGRQARLIDIATKIFLQDGFTAATIDGIAVTAGISKRTIYARYPNKEALFLEVVKHLTERRVLAGPPLDGDMPIEEGLRQHARALFRASFQPDVVAFQRMVLCEINNFPELGKTLWRIVEEGYGAQLAQYFRVQRDKGVIRNFKPSYLADLFMENSYAFINKVLVLRQDIPTNRQIEDYLDDLIDILLNGLRR